MNEDVVETNSEDFKVISLQDFKDKKAKAASEALQAKLIDKAIAHSKKLLESEDE